MSELAKAKRVGMYLRVSTQEQSTELQLRELTEFVKSRGWIVSKIYEDKLSGTSDNRPKLKELLTDAREHVFDVLVIWKLDRLFRSLKGLINSIQELNELGIEFVSLRDNIDLSTSAGRLMVHILGAFGEFEASIIKDRVKAGIRNSRAKGKIWGRPKTRPSELIRSLADQGLSYRNISKVAHCSLSTVVKELKSRSVNPGFKEAS